MEVQLRQLATPTSIIHRLIDLGVEFQVTERSGVAYEYKGELPMSPEKTSVMLEAMNAMESQKEGVNKHLHKMAEVWRSLWRDPRPDLDKEFGDGRLWSELLLKAARVDVELWYNLRAFRILSTAFRTNPKTGTLRLAPLFSPSDHHEVVPGWANQQEYEKMREQYLYPWRTDLQRIIEEVTHEHV